MNKNDLYKKLTEEEYRVAVLGGTEEPFTGELLHEMRAGIFVCKVCGAPLFSSDTKFESDTGWPSFDKALPNAVSFIEDITYDVIRTEVRCVKCDSHLGHLFLDGPTESGERFCVNSVCLSFKNENEIQENPLD